QLLQQLRLGAPLNRVPARRRNLDHGPLLELVNPEHTEPRALTRDMADPKRPHASTSSADALLKAVGTDAGRPLPRSYAPRCFSVIPPATDLCHPGSIRRLALPLSQNLPHHPLHPLRPHLIPL